MVGGCRVHDDGRVTELLHPVSPAGSPAEPAADRPIGRRAAAVALVSFAALLCVLAYEGGSTEGGPLLLLGFAALLGMMAAAGAAAWWLFGSRLPEGEGPAAAAPAGPPASATSGLPALLPQVVAFAAGLGGLLLTGGASWDASWHRRYGTQIVLDDFFWPPHLVIYGSMALTGGFSVLAAWVALRGSGGLRRRVRAMPVVGVVGLVAAYLGLSGPSDLVWHRAYGKDISAWSLPHLILATLTALVVLCGAAVVVDPTSRLRWAGPRALSVRDGLSLLMMMAGTAPMLLVFAADYSGQALPPGVDPVGPYLRPDWWYPVTITVLGALYGSVVAALLRRVGAATLWAAGLVAFQAGLMTLFDGWSQPFASALMGHLLLLPTALALDLWLAFRTRRGRSPALPAGAAVAGAVGAVAALVAVGAWTSYPQVDAGLAAWTLAVAVPLGAWGGWFGGLTGTAVARLGGMAPVPRLEPRVYRGAALAVAASVVLLAGYVAVSPPPDTLCRELGDLCLLNASR